MASCPACGETTEAGQVICTNCGHGLSVAGVAANSVKQPVVANKDYLLEFSTKDAIQTRYDVYVTSDKLTFIKTQSGATGLGAFWTALLGGIIYGRLTRKNYGDDLTLKQKLAAAKGSFVVTSKMLTSLQLVKVLGQHVLEVEFTAPSGRAVSMRLTMKGESYDALSQILPTLPALSPKIR